MPLTPETAFLRANLRLVLAVLAGVSRFAGYVEGARNADSLRRTGEAVRQALKWDTDPSEGSVLVREDRLGAFIRTLEGRADDSERLEEIARAAADLYGTMDYRSGFTSSAHAERWADYSIPNDLEARASRLARLLEALIADGMGEGPAS